MYTQLCAYYGKDAIVPIYIEVEDGLRLQRALDRERMQDNQSIQNFAGDFLQIVDDIRQQVNNDIVIKPYSSKYKIYIIQKRI